MAITGTPKNLDDRSFLTGNPLFDGIACFYYGGSNKNLLTQRNGRAYRDFSESPTLSYVDAPLNNLPTSKAIVGATDRDSIVLDAPTTALTNDLPGQYGDFTILVWARLNNSGSIFSLNNFTDDPNSIWITTFVDSGAADGTVHNMFINIKGSLSTIETGGGFAVKGLTTLYCLRRQGTSLTVSVNDVPGTPITIDNVGTVSLSGLTLFGRRNLEPYDNRRSIPEISLFQVYKRRLSNQEVQDLYNNPFTILPDPSGTIIPPVSGYRKDAAAFNIGNSVTDTIAPSKLKLIANDNAVRYQWARQVILGAPLDLIAATPDGGFVEQPYSYPTNALVNFTWNILSLQPFDRGLPDDLAACQYFINLLYSRPANANARVLIFSRWARQINESSPGSTIYPAYDIATLWSRPSSSMESKAYFEDLLIALRAVYPTKQIDICPVGDALLLLDTEAKAGRVPGIATAKDLFADGIHFTEVGQFFVGMVYYATIYKEDPKDLGFVGYSGVTQPLADKLQSIAWTTVDKHPYSGVDSSTIIIPPPDPTPTPNPGIPFGCKPFACTCNALPCLEIQAGKIFDQVLAVELDGKPLVMSSSAALTFTVKNGTTTVATISATILKKTSVRLKLTPAQTLPLAGEYTWTGTIVDGAKTTTLGTGEFWVRGV